MFGNLATVGIEHVNIWEKTGAEIPEDPSYGFLKIWNMGSRKHEMDIW